MWIDAHHHFWQFDPSQYGWITESMGVLRRDFLPADLEAETSPTQVQGVISVQARQSLAETDWLLQLAEQHALIRAVVGWVPLGDDRVERHLEHYALRPKLRAVRHVLQDEPDPEYMLRPAFQRGIALLHTFDLVYDLLIYEHQLSAAIKLVDQHPDQVFVLDHMAKPPIRSGRLEPWARHLRELARRPHVFCKLSGLTTEADHQDWQPDQLQPYVDVALECFGPSRLMFGSDWPVCLLAVTYRRWFEVVQFLTTSLSEDERERVFGGTAIQAYGLDRVLVS